jgi:hypothetical protein
MTSCSCIAITGARIYILDTYGNIKSGWGYGANYGNSYGVGESNKINPQDLGSLTSNAQVKVNIKHKRLNAGYGLAVDNTCSTIDIDNITLELNSTCWTAKNIALLFGVEPVTVAPIMVNKRIYTNQFMNDCLILDGEIASFNASIQPTNIALVLGVDYFIQSGNVYWLKDIHLNSGQYIDFTATTKAYQSLKVSRASMVKCGLAIVGKNADNGKIIKYKFLNVNLMPADFELTLPDTEAFQEIKLYGEVKRDVYGNLYSITWE